MAEPVASVMPRARAPIRSCRRARDAAMMLASARRAEATRCTPTVWILAASTADAAANLPSVAVSRSAPSARLAAARFGTGGSAFAGTLSSNERIASSSDSRFQSMGRRSSGTRKTSRDQPDTTAWIGAGSGGSLPLVLSGSSGRPFATGYAGTVVKYAISARCCGGSVTMR